MSKQIAVVALSFVLFTLGDSVQAQQPGKTPRIGYLSAYSKGAIGDRIDAFLQGLRDLGYVEEKNVRIDYRYMDAKLDRVPGLVAELLALPVNVIVAGGGLALVHEIKKSTTTIPIVMTSGSDPVEAGLIASLARPGGNVTGLVSFTLDLSGKRLEILKEAIPKLLRAAVLYDVGNPPKIREFKETRAAARSLGVEIQPLEVRSPDDFDAAFKSAALAKAHGLIILQSPLTVGQRKQIADLALKDRLPTMVAESGLLDRGGLMSYGPDYADLYHRAATYVDKILKGVQPADLPVERPVRFEFVVSLKVAKQLGVTIDPQVLARATRIIR